MKIRYIMHKIQDTSSSL